MNSRLQSLFDVLDQHERFLPLDDLVAELRAVEPTLDDLAPYVEFSDDHYRRNLVRKTATYEALVLCWRSGQRSPIHDHVGSRCGLRVLKGQASEIVYDFDRAQRLVQTVRHEYVNGEVCGSQDRDIHEIVNKGDTDLITLHVYTPPLADINIYDRDSGTAAPARALVNAIQVA